MPAAFVEEDADGRMALRGTNQELGRSYNRRIVLETIRRHSPITRTEIASEIGLTIQTVSTIIHELSERGFLRARREPPRGRGLPAEAFAIDPEGGYALAIDVTPVTLEVALVDLAGEVVMREQQPLPHGDPDRCFARIAELRAELTRPYPAQRILGAGMAMPGPFDVEAMSFLGPTALEGWQGIDPPARLAAATGLPSFVEGDLAAAALGEWLYGTGHRFSTWYYLYIGHGVGGRLVLHGTPLRGARGNAGEIGHVPVVPEGEPCACGNRGCLERYVSLEAFERRPPDIDLGTWCRAAAPMLRTAVHTIENLFDPETIILGGLAPTTLLEGLVAAAVPLPNTVAARRDRATPRLLVAGGGRDAALRGAAALALWGVLSPGSVVPFGGSSAGDDAASERSAHAKGGLAA